jgi:hypothetical protein
MFRGQLFGMPGAQSVLRLAQRTHGRYYGSWDNYNKHVKKLQVSHFQNSVNYGNGLENGGMQTVFKFR